MLAARVYRNIALVGFMGAGKTTVGSTLAHLLKFEFIDTDRIIEARERRKIADLFATEGEAYFRQKERQVCLELESTSEKVISTGGGMIMDPDNLDSLQQHALVVCLWASPETIFQRLKHQTHRPLLQTPNPLATIRELMERRGPMYRRADVLVGVDFRSPSDTARHIANSFRRIQKVAKPIPESRSMLSSPPPTLTPTSLVSAIEAPSPGSE